MSEFSVVQENAERALALARETKAELERLRAENAALKGQIVQALDVSQRHGRRHSHEDPLIFATTAEIADVSTAEATGTDRTVPRGGHVHALGSGLAYATTTQLADVADAEANGSSPLIPRGDHVHKLGILTTKGDLISYSTLPARVGVGANSKVLMADSTATPGVAWTALNKAIVIHINGGGSVLTTGVKLYLSVPITMTITGWDLVADQSGSIVIDVWKDTYANFPPTVADTIAGSEKPTLASVQKNQDTSLSSWTTAITAGDVLGFNIDSITTCTWITLTLRCTAP